VATIGDVIKKIKEREVLLEKLEETRAVVESALRFGALRCEAERNAAMVDEILRPTDPYWILLRSRSTSRQRRAAARKLAARMSTRFANPKVRAELRAMTRPGGLQRWLREEVFVPALLEAARERRRPQRIRLGTKWIKDASGRIARVRPMERSIPFLRYWLSTRARALAEERILGGRRLGHLSARQRELLLLLQPHPDYADVAERMGVTPEAVRQLAARARAKPHQHESSKSSPKGRHS
jgi:DNA-directed RNA polymerase specialized sigma24 family protein